MSCFTFTITPKSPRSFRWSSSASNIFTDLELHNTQLWWSLQADKIYFRNVSWFSTRFLWWKLLWRLLLWNRGQKLWISSSKSRATSERKWKQGSSAGWNKPELSTSANSGGISINDWVPYQDTAELRWDPKTWSNQRSSDKSNSETKMRKPLTSDFVCWPEDYKVLFRGVSESQHAWKTVSHFEQSTEQWCVPCCWHNCELFSLGSFCELSVLEDSTCRVIDLYWSDKKKKMIKCRNLKLSFQVKTDFAVVNLVDINSELKTRNVSHIIRNFDLGCVFTIYKHNLGQIHATGIRHKIQLDQIISFIDLKCSLISLRVDNSLFSCKGSKPINLSGILNKVLSKFKDYVPSYSEQIYPAMFLKPIEKKVGNPTIILYHNSSYVILGGNCKKKIKQANCFVTKLIEWTNNMFSVLNKISNLTPCFNFFFHTTIGGDFALLVDHSRWPLCSPSGHQIEKITQRNNKKSHPGAHPVSRPPAVAGQQLTTFPR